MLDGTSVTAHLRFTAPPTAKLPDRVLLIFKERDTLFPFRRKLTFVHLASWTRLPNAVWQSNVM